MSDVYTERRDDHRIEIEHVSIVDGVLEELEICVVHPESCMQRPADYTSMDFATPQCALGFEEMNAGTSETLGIVYWSQGGEHFDRPAEELIGLALTTSRASLPITYVYKSWVDRNGEGDMELGWWPR